MDGGPLAGRTLERLITVQAPSPSADAAGAVRGLAVATDQAVDELLSWAATAVPGGACN